MPDPKKITKVIAGKLTNNLDLLSPFLSALDKADEAEPIVPEFAPKMLEAGLDGLATVTLDKMTGASATVRAAAPALEAYFLRLITDEDEARKHLGLPPLRQTEKTQGMEAMFAEMLKLCKSQGEQLAATRLENERVSQQLAEVLERTTRKVGPLFSEAADAYIALKKDTHGEDYDELKYLRHRKAVFLQLLPDKPVGLYTADDLQTFINRIRYLSPNLSKQPGYKIEDVMADIKNNERAGRPGIAESTLKNNYIGKVKTIIKHGCSKANIPYILEHACIDIPRNVPKPVQRLTPDYRVLGKVFGKGVESGLLAEAMLPLMGFLTGRRLGILTYIRAEDIQYYHDVWIVMPKQLVEVNQQKIVTPHKTNESLRYFVLHNFFAEIGFVHWAKSQSGFLFKALHTAKDPADTASKRMARLFRSAEVDPAIFKTFHGTRHAKINVDRELKVDPRTIRLQVGHELTSVHDKYGEAQLQRRELHEVATNPLPDGIDWSMFNGLDFKALAENQPLSGRPRKKC